VWRTGRAAEQCCSGAAGASKSAILPPTVLYRPAAGGSSHANGGVDRRMRHARHTAPSRDGVLPKGQAADAILAIPFLS